MALTVSNPCVEDAQEETGKPLPEVGRKSAKLDEKVLELEQLQILLSN
jgi:hypothetical protein